MTSRPEALEVSKEAMGELRKAVGEFNSWRFYDCHETLEDVWRDSGAKGSAEGATNFYQGLIKSAAGFHHLLRGNHHGTVTLLSDSVRLLGPYRPECLGIDVEALVAAVGACLRRIAELGEGRLEEFERGMIPRITIRDQK
jgi:predicted metal-dependent hydrolase